MENSNFVNISLDLSTKQGLVMFAAIAAILTANGVEAPKVTDKKAPKATAPVAPTAPSIPSVPTAPTAPAAPKAPKAPKAPAAPVVAFDQLDEEGKREAIKKITTKHSKRGKTADIKTLFAAYGASNVESIPADYLDHFNWAINTFDTNGQNMEAVLSAFSQG